MPDHLDTPAVTESEPFIDAPEGTPAYEHLAEQLGDQVADAALATLDASPDPVTLDTVAEALASELVKVAEQFDNVDAEKRTEGIEAAPVFDGFDPVKAWTAVTELNDDYRIAIKEEERTKRLHSDAKKERDDLGAQLSKLISDINNRKGDGVQPPLKTITDDPAASIAARDSALQALSFALLGRQCFIEVADLAKLSDQDRGVLHAWATTTKKGPILPFVLGSAHVADHLTPEGQCCTKCGYKFPRDKYETPFLAGSRIGLDCMGANLDEARPIAKRGSKKTKKVDHDGERAEQVKAGKRKAAKKA